MLRSAPQRGWCAAAQVIVSSGLPAVNIACVSGAEPPGVWEALAVALEGFFFGDGFRLQGSGGGGAASAPEGPALPRVRPAAPSCRPPVCQLCTSGRPGCACTWSGPTCSAL